MKVLYISNNLGQGGKERQIHELLKFFQNSTDVQFGLLLREQTVNYNLEEINKTKFFIPAKRLSLTEFFNFAAKNIKVFKPDVIHTWEGGTALITSILKLVCYPGTPIVDGTLRYANSFSKTTKYYWVERINRTIAKKVIANTNAGLRSIDYANAQKFSVIPNGLNFSRFNFDLERSNSTAKEEIIIGMTASFSKPKDYTSFVKSAIALLNKKHPIRVILIGDGNEKKEIESLIPEIYKNKFEFTGNIEHPETKIKSFDIGVLFNKKGESEGMSNSIMEYMVFSLPVVCTNTGGNPDMVKDNYNGFLTEHENIEQIENKLERLITDSELRKMMGERSGIIAREKFDIKEVANKYLNLYQEVLV
jgi:glycosyltransferase involved in cell wall biosynthesis